MRAGPLDHAPLTRHLAAGPAQVPRRGCVVGGGEAAIGRLTGRGRHLHGPVNVLPEPSAVTPPPGRASSVVWISGPTSYLCSRPTPHHHLRARQARWTCHGLSRWALRGQRTLPSLRQRRTAQKAAHHFLSFFHVCSPDPSEEFPVAPHSCFRAPPLALPAPLPAPSPLQLELTTPAAARAPFLVTSLHSSSPCRQGDRFPSPPPAAQPSPDPATQGPTQHVRRPRCSPQCFVHCISEASSAAGIHAAATGPEWPLAGPRPPARLAVLHVVREAVSFGDSLTRPLPFRGLSLAVSPKSAGGIVGPPRPDP